MRIEALNLLDRPPPKWRDEFHEISVPLGLALAEQIVRPERTKPFVLCKCDMYGIYVTSSERPSGHSELTQT
jgi:hypothetical protein